MAENEDEILCLDLKNSSARFRIFYERYAELLFRYVYRLTGNPEASEEILHDIFVELIGGKFKIGPDSNLKSWLYTLAKNKSLNYVKNADNKKKSRERMGEYSSEMDLEDSSIKKNLLKKLSGIEKIIPSELQATWRLRKQGMDYQEIAETLKIPVGTVKSRFHRLVEFLKKEFNS